MADVSPCECSARDGLQHESGFVPTETKVRLVERFAQLGFARVEASSYSNRRIVPRFADASELLARPAGRPHGAAHARAVSIVRLRVSHWQQCTSCMPTGL